MTRDILLTETQKLVDMFATQINRQLNIKLEPIAVRRRFVDPSFMLTGKGFISIDHDLSSSTSRGRIETGVLHELGHRVQMCLNKYSDMMIRGGHLKRLVTRPWTYNIRRISMVEGILSEGIAENFGLEIFPEFCDLSEEGRKQVMYEIQQHSHKYNPESPYSRGYHFFNDFVLDEREKGLVTYIKQFRISDVPTAEELDNPERYWARWYKNHQRDIIKLRSLELNR